MKTIVVIINGIGLPYHVIDHAIKEAKEDSCEVLGLFLKGTYELPKGYIFPSDLGTLETGATDEEVVAEDEKIIADNILLIKQMIENEKIAFHSIQKTNPSLEEIKEMTASAALIFIDETFNEILLGDDKITLDDLKTQLSAPLHVVSSKT